MELKVGKTVVSLIKGDITQCNVDAIVNAANSALQMGGGVAGAIRRTGGESIQQECDRIGGTPVGTAVITSAGKLMARYVIHTVGPMMGEGDEDTKLENATRASLELADQKKLKSIALPAVSSGIFGYPVDRCARKMLSTTMKYLSEGAHSLEKVIFCLFDDKTYNEFKENISLLSKCKNRDD